MSGKSYNSIKKYAAFIFMVFTVLSGSYDKLEAGRPIKAAKDAFVDILVINKLIIQGIKASAADSETRSLIQEHQGFREFLDIDITAYYEKQLKIYVLPLIMAVLCLNNSIAQNNIWRNVLF